MSRLIVDISSEQHQVIKALAATEGKTIKDYVLERLLPVSEDASTDEAWNELKSILAKRIENACTQGISSRSVTDIMEATLKTKT